MNCFGSSECLEHSRYKDCGIIVEFALSVGLCALIDRIGNHFGCLVEVLEYRLIGYKLEQVRPSIRNDQQRPRSRPSTQGLQLAAAK